MGLLNLHNYYKDFKFFNQNTFFKTIRGEFLRLKEFQQLMRQLYYKNDYERGVLKTTLWLFEEIGELASAIVKDRSYEELEEELADIIAWTASLANIMNIDLVTAINKKYHHCLNLLTNFDLGEDWSV